MVYHYTTIETIYSILASYKEADNKEYLTFWASNVLDQNDYSEMSLGFDELKESVLEVEKELEAEGRDISLIKLSEALRYSFLGGKDQNDVIEEVEDISGNIEKAPFTMSFSMLEDSLLMWSIYANKGNGVCLVFDENELDKFQTEMIVLQGNIRYGKTKENCKDLVKLHYEAYLSIFEDMKPIIMNAVAYQGELAYKTMKELICPFIKNNSFRDENEWRVVFFRNRTTKVFTRITSSLNTIHYIKIGVPLSSLKRIIIGPCADTQKVKDFLVSASKDCGIDKMSDPSFYATSNVPFRIV